MCLPFPGRVAVVGNGPIGAAVARSLQTKYGAPAGTGARVELFASPPTELWSAHADRGRITRVLDFEHAEEWVDWNRRSLGQWRELEQESGVSFFTQCGSLVFATPDELAKLQKQVDPLIAPREEDQDEKKMWGQEGHVVPGGAVYVDRDRATTSSIGNGIGGVALGAAVPSHGLFEFSAGYVDPEELIRAQNVVFEKDGGILRWETVDRVETMSVLSTATGVTEEGEDDDKFMLHCGGRSGSASGQEREQPPTRTYGPFDVVVLCAGAWTNALLARSFGQNESEQHLAAALPYRVSRRAVVLAEVSSDTVEGPLARMPAMKVELSTSDHSAGDHVVVDDNNVAPEQQRGVSLRCAREAASVFILPPIWYPEYNGYFVKIGGGPNDFIDETSGVSDQIERWRNYTHTGEGEHDVPASALPELLKRSLFRVLPDLEKHVLGWRVKRCITTTAADAPLFREVRHSKSSALLVVANCQGKAVTASAAIGDDVANMFPV